MGQSQSQWVKAVPPDAVPDRVEPLLEEILGLMQEGKWRQAGEALTVLERSYPDSPGAQELRETLALHLSAEAGWRGCLLQVPAVRILVVANLVAYLLAAMLWLLTILGPGGQ